MKPSMKDLDEIINQSKDVREVKRALCVKMALSEMPTSHLCEMLNVSQPFVSKWRTKYEAQGAEALLLGYQGSLGRLSVEQRQELLSWIGSQESIRIEELRDYLQEQYQVVYQSKQSYYELLQAAGMSYHKSEKENPKRDEAQVVEQRDVIKKKWRSTLKRSARVK